MKELIAVIGMLAVCIGIVIGLFACSESAGTKRYQEKLAQYEIICINGIDYYTADIVSVQYNEGGYSGDSVTLEMKDGSIIRFDVHNYTLKNKK